ncbi:MAG: tRNA guanosine(34) transglycosylase Tgt [Bacteroidota bacterium]|nr:tRNA guanosine(34) transglycosylase Tgt [Bacteroidota bacterium]
MAFRLVHSSGRARAGVLATGHGPVETPVFMPVGTAGAIKALSPRHVMEDLGAGIILSNTYHLYLRPSVQPIAKAGGLHRFMAWPRAILTDSGGYQVYSLAARCRVSDEGAQFQSHIDGSQHMFTPERVVDFQRILGSDIMMVLDECPPAGISHPRARQSAALTTRWARRSLAHFQKSPRRYEHRQLLFGIVQGSIYEDLRRDHARELTELDFPGYAIGGLSVGESESELYAMVAAACEELPEQKPRYLMGVGTPANLLEAIARGVDMCDCVMPTRNGRNGMVFTTEGIINIRNRKWAGDCGLLDPGLDTYVSQTFTRAYLRHLFRCSEILGLQIATAQNLALYLWLMRQARRAILEDRFEGFARSLSGRLQQRL